MLGRLIARKTGRPPGEALAPLDEAAKPPGISDRPGHDREAPRIPLEQDPLYRAEPAGRSTDRRTDGRRPRYRAVAAVKGLFVDTARWMVCADAADPAHGPACAARDAALEKGRLLITTDYVIDETLTLVRMRIGLRAAEAWWQQIEGSPRLRWEWIGVSRAEKARRAFFSAS